MTIIWRGFELRGTDGESWSCEYESGYVGVSWDGDNEPDPKKHYSALIECGELTGEGVGWTAHDALDDARRNLSASCVDHTALVERHFFPPDPTPP